MPLPRPLRRPDPAPWTRAAAALCLAALLAAPAPGRALGGGDLRASRAQGEIAVDGRLDEGDWLRAEPFDDFVQGFPVEGAAPSERTEVRVLHDDHTLYVGIRCLDGHPAAIVRPLGRRDAAPSSDQVTVLVDANLDRRTAVQFTLTAGGVEGDALVYDDDRVSIDWDAVWEGAVAELPDGWSAELAIPLSALRFPDVPSQVWGFGVQRELGRTHEKMATVLLPRSGRGLASRLGLLRGIEGIRPGLDLEVTPYLAARLSHAPLHADPSLPDPRVWNAAADVGADLRLRLGSRLTLAAAVNPDFGQVEADQIILNLSTFETFFPEKRPFFTQGLDLFQPVGAGFEKVLPQQLFYSRRIGLDAPILGAMKLVGRLSDRVEVGLLDAVVAGTGQAGAAAYPTVAEAEAGAGRGLRWTWAQPFRLAPDRAYPTAAPAAVNHLAGVLRVQAADRLVLGLQGTSALLLGAPCSPADDAASPPQRRAACDALGGAALALDANATSPDGEWYAYGQATASRAGDGPPSRTLPDGTVLARGDLGLGGYLRAGRRGGEPWRLELGFARASPRLDVNASGFQRTQNVQELQATLKHVRTGREGTFRELTTSLGGSAAWTTDGRGLLRATRLTAGLEALVPEPWVELGLLLELEGPYDDVREIAGSGIPLRRPGWWSLYGSADTDPARAVSWSVEAWGGRNLPLSPLGTPWFFGAGASVALRPHPRLETRLGANLDWSEYAIRHVAALDAAAPGAGDLAFGALTAPALSLVLRQLVVLAPRLTLQVYAQLFTAWGGYGPFWLATRAPGDLATVQPAELRPWADAPAGPDFHSTDLVVNAVLRWEYRPGSTLFVVYARNQAESPWAGEGPPPHGLAPRGLATGPTGDSLLVKWAVWLGR